MPRPPLPHHQVRKFLGYALILSPWLNFFHSVALEAPNNWWQWYVISNYITTITAVSYLLWGSALGAGLMLVLRGSQNLVYAIGLLGINVFYGLLNFGRDLHNFGWFQPTLQLVFNILLLSFVVWSELQETKSTTQKHFPKTTLKPVTTLKPAILPVQKFAITLRRVVHVRLSQDGVWAQILQIQQNGVLLRLLRKQVPTSLQNQVVELCLPDQLTLRMKAFSFTRQVCEFHFVDIDPRQLQQLRIWAQKTKKSSTGASPAAETAAAS